MGIDVYGVFQVKHKEKWICIRSFDDGRRGYLRAWLGCDFYKGPSLFKIMPVVPLRGLPSDFDPLEQVDDVSYKRSFEAGILVGEWGLSWLLGEEILSHGPALAVRYIEVSMEMYAATWDKTDDIEHWRAMTRLCLEDDLPPLVSISYLQESLAYNVNQVRVECIYDFSEELNDFKNEVQQLQEHVGPIRFVYGFA